MQSIGVQDVPVCEVKNGMPRYWPTGGLTGNELSAMFIGVGNKEQLCAVVDRLQDENVVSARWVNTNKGDSVRPNTRSRHVGLQFLFWDAVQAVDDRSTGRPRPSRRRYRQEHEAMRISLVDIKLTFVAKPQEESQSSCLMN